MKKYFGRTFKIGLIFFAVWALILFLGDKALAYCSDPSPPDKPYTSYRPVKPSLPYCADTYSNTHTCDQWEVDNYNDEIEQYNYDVEEYIRKLNNYINEANDFLSEVVDYGKCEVRNLD